MQRRIHVLLLLAIGTGLSMESLSSSYCAHTDFPYSFSTLHICRLVEIRYAHPHAILISQLLRTW
jgi:hypothetical protein